MPLRLSTATRSALAAAFAARVDLGTNPGTIRIYSGTQPASANDATAGTLLATFTLADPSFTEASGVLTLDADPDLATTGAATGAATWFRMADSSNNTVADGSVSATGGGGELQLNSTAISTGVAVTITTGTVTVPAG